MKLWSQADQQLHEDIGRFYHDPLGFVMYSFPWLKEKTHLEHFDGPLAWQISVLKYIGRESAKRNFNGRDAVKPIMLAVTSGHGIGKSALVAMIVMWLMSTRPYCKGTITASVMQQLETKTWGELFKWKEMCITGGWFHVSSSRNNLKIWHKTWKETWNAAGQTCKKDNAQAFAGQHAITSSSFYIFDEASEVPDIIWETAQGGLTDGEPHWYVFGNPVKNQGRFKECFGKYRHRWATMQIDSRDVRITNKELLAEAIEDNGIDSDFVKIRVLGQFPRLSAEQLIAEEIADMAIGRYLRPDTYKHEAKVLGVDVAWWGDNKHVLVERQGNYSRVVMALPHLPNESASLTKIIAQKIVEEKYDMVFIDATGVGAGVYDSLKQLGFSNVMPVLSGARASEPDRYKDVRTEIWDRMAEWLIQGSVNGEERHLIDVREEMITPMYTFVKNAKKLESKKDMKARGVLSPDIADALAFTFTMPVMKLTGDYARNRAVTEYSVLSGNYGASETSETNYEVLRAA